MTPPAKSALHSVSTDPDGWPASGLPGDESLQALTSRVASGPTAPHAASPARQDKVDRSVTLRQMMRPVASYMADESVREITIPRPGDVFLKIGGQWQYCAAPELTFDYLQGLSEAMASYNKMNFAPIMSLKLPDGERGQVIRPPALIDGNLSINIRKHSTTVKTLEELAQEGAFSGWNDSSKDKRKAEDEKLLALKAAGDMVGFLHYAVQIRRNIVIGGKTGSGKTTFARSLIERVPFHERLITIEDVHELFLPNHPNRVHLIFDVTPGAPVSAKDCVAACMRMSPDRIFLSELRGPEAWEYLQGLNTGHPGSVTTTHANSAIDIYDRLAMLVKQAPAGQQIDLDIIRRYLLSTLDIALYYADYKLVEVYFDPHRERMH